MKKLPFIRYKKIYLGGRKRQRGGSLLFGASLAIPLLSKLLTGRGRKRKRRKW